MKYLAICWVFLATAVNAQNSLVPRTIDMTKPILDSAGHPAHDTTDDPNCGKECPLFTVGAAISHVLNSPCEEFDPRSGRCAAPVPDDQKWPRSALADRIRNDKAARLDHPTLALIERLLIKAYTGPVIKQVIPYIDPNYDMPGLK